MSRLQGAAALLFGLTALIGCESPGQKSAELRAEEELVAAKRQLTLGAMGYNLDVCYKHLGVTELTADKSVRWKKFMAAHHITSHPVAMSDGDLKDCEALQR